VGTWQDDLDGGGRTDDKDRGESPALETGPVFEPSVTGVTVQSSYDLR
jgi:hypothetical protein